MGQRPPDHGVDLVLHSATKAISGHNDATLGVIAGDKTIINELWAYSTIQGSCASPYDSWNGLRGMKTLAIRHDHQTRTTTAVMAALENHPAVTTVHYPGSASRAQSDLAGRQLCFIGSCISFDLVDGYDAAVQVVEGLQVALLAPALGGLETLEPSRVDDPCCHERRTTRLGGNHRRNDPGLGRTRTRRGPTRRLRSSPEPTHRLTKSSADRARAVRQTLALGVGTPATGARVLNMHPPTNGSRPPVTMYMSCMSEPPRTTLVTILSGTSIERSGSPLGV